MVSVIHYKNKHCLFDCEDKNLGKGQCGATVHNMFLTENPNQVTCGNCMTALGGRYKTKYEETKLERNLLSNVEQRIASFKAPPRFDYDDIDCVRDNGTDIWVRAGLRQQVPLSISYLHPNELVIVKEWLENQLEVKRVCRVMTPEILDYLPGGEHYQQLKKAMGEFGKVGYWGFRYLNFNGGAVDFTKQYHITLQIPKDCKFPGQIKNELVEIARYLKPNENGRIYLGLFDHKDPKEATYSIEHSKEDGIWYLVKHVHFNRNEKSFDTIEAFIEYLILNHWRS